MKYEDSHLSDQQLLLEIENELTGYDEKLVHAHLDTCWKCRTRRQELETAIADFVHSRQQEFDSKIPPAAGPRALLKVLLAENARQSAAPRRLVLAQAALGLTLGGVAIALVLYLVPRPNTASVPRPQLTPGVVRPVMKSDVCAVSGNQALVVPVALQRRVFEEYGIRNAQLDAYEVDYLITPELGGASDIRNLWPQPYSSTVWNARVKDALEQRLHQMVCDGQLDLATAQHDIATNWIAAYKKYFNSSRPRQN